MITVLGLMLFGLALVGVAADKLQGDDESAPQAKPSGVFDALLLALCFVSVLAAHKRRETDDDG